MASCVGNGGEAVLVCANNHTLRVRASSLVFPRGMTLSPNVRLDTNLATLGDAPSTEMKSYIFGCTSRSRHPLYTASMPNLVSSVQTQESG